MKNPFVRFMLIGALSLILACLVASAFIAISNQFLPTRSNVTDRLSELEKGRVLEAIHLQKSLGDIAWPGWGEQEIPFIVYNEEYAFLIGLTDPAEGWKKMPQQMQRGAAWEVVSGDSMDGEVYYRQPLPDPEITPENFTVLVGTRWVATMQTKEYAEIRFYADLKQELPGGLKYFFPYKLAWGVLMGETESYLGGLEHESFHAFQGISVPERLALAEEANQYERDYPWDDPVFEQQWIKEMDLLVQAVWAETDEEAVELASQFLAQRDERRTTSALTPDMIDYERQRDWLEGLAKYAELSIQRLAGATQSYTPTAAMSEDPEFSAYSTREQYWEGQIDEVRRSGGRVDETRFYYGGMAQAVVLDRLLPGWKARIFDPGVMLEDLLREAVRDP